MKTVQEWLNEADETRIVEACLLMRPVDFPMLRDKTLSVAEVLDAAKSNFKGFINEMRAMKAIRSDESIFYAVYSFRDGTPDVDTVLSHREDILNHEMPESYWWAMTALPTVMGYLVADTKLTTDYIEDVLAQIINGFAFFGFSQKEIEEKRADLEKSLAQSEEDIKNGRTLTAEEVFSKYGLPEDEPDEKADELKSSVYAAMYEYEKHFRIREALKVRALLG